MKIIADTSIWSQFLRRSNTSDSPEVEFLKQAILERRIQMLGIVRQELLSGIKNPTQFIEISQILQGFPDLLASSEDHLIAAQFFNRCRSHGIQGSPVDFLICAQAHRNDMKILTLDKDFHHYTDYLPIRLAV